VLVGCAGPGGIAEQPVSPQQQQIYNYEAKRCVEYGFPVISPEYVQCRQLLSEMRSGGMGGATAGLQLEMLVRQSGRPAPEPTRPTDFSQFGDPAQESEPATRSRSPPPKPSEVYGTGFYVSGDGYIITNWHVAGNCASIQTPDGIVLSYVSSDKAADLALLHAVSKKPPSVAEFRQSEAVVGESVIVFGYPLPGLLSTSGITTNGTVNAVSGVGNNPRDIQISAPVQPGNSGGPLLDQYGRVIGVVVAKLDAGKVAEMTGDIPQNVNFAIKARQVFDFLKKSNVNPQKTSKWFQRSNEAIAALAASFTIQIICQRDN
jgi:S1-C subfamily serine protease